MGFVVFFLLFWATYFRASSRVSNYIQPKGTGTKRLEEVVGECRLIIPCAWH